MSKMELFSTDEVAKKLKISKQLIGKKCKKMNILPYKKQGDKNHFFTLKQITLLSGIDFEHESPILYIVHKHTQEIILESKINKKSAVYGTHRRV
jgi:hypothetical protein